VSQEAVGPDFQIAYYRSSDETYSGDDVRIGTETITDAAGKSVGSHTRTDVGLTITEPGPWYLFGVLDDGSVVSETNESNNVTSASGPIEVASVPVPPQIGSLTASPSPAEIGQDVTLTAWGGTDADGTVTEVRFYLDSNGSGSLDVGTDELLGVDDVGPDWTAVFSTTGRSAGTYRYFAQAKDNEDLLSSAATTTSELAEPTVEWILDDGDVGFTKTGSNWSHFSPRPDCYQGDYFMTNVVTGGHEARWTFGSLLAGEYEVYTTWRPYSTRATNAPYRIYDGSQQVGYAEMNQKTGGGSSISTSLGTYRIDSGTLVVSLTDQGADGKVCADAVRVVRIGS